MIDLNRFLKAQAGNVYETALMEVRQGKAIGHWIWYVFPQMLGLGDSGMSKYYAIADKPDAEAYLSEPTLGARLREISAALLEVEGRTAVQIFGKHDAAKLHSSMTLFDAVCPDDVFAAVLDRYFEGNRCVTTIELLKEATPAPPPIAVPTVTTTGPSAPEAALPRKRSLWRRVTNWFKR